MRDNDGATCAHQHLPAFAGCRSVTPHRQNRHSFRAQYTGLAERLCMLFGWLGHCSAECNGAHQHRARRSGFQVRRGISTGCHFSGCMTEWHSGHKQASCCVGGSRLRLPFNATKALTHRSACRDSVVAGYIKSGVLPCNTTVRYWYNMNSSVFSCEGGATALCCPPPPSSPPPPLPAPPCSPTTQFVSMGCYLDPGPGKRPLLLLGVVSGQDQVGQCAAMVERAQLSIMALGANSSGRQDASAKCWGGQRQNGQQWPASIITGPPTLCNQTCVGTALACGGTGAFSMYISGGWAWLGLAGWGLAGWGWAG